MGIRVSARIEHRATPITRTTTETGLRRALRRSHMAISLLPPRRAATAKTGRDRPGPPRPTRDSARRRAAPTRHRSPPARESFVSRQHPRASRGPLDSALVPASRSCARRSEEHTSELQSRLHLVCRLLLEKKKNLENPIAQRRKQKKNYHVR